MTAVDVPHPLFISPRLMAAFKVDEIGTLHVSVAGRDAEGRIQYNYLIEDGDGVELENGDDLRSGVGADPDFLEILSTLLSFLGAAAEREDDDGDGALFNGATTAWARQNSDELAMAEQELNQNPGDHNEDCIHCMAGNREPHLAEPLGTIGYIVTCSAWDHSPQLQFKADWQEARALFEQVAADAAADERGWAQLWVLKDDHATFLTDHR